MQRFYRAILQLYPAEYRAAFAPELIEVFEQASRDSRKRGLLNFIFFAAGEFTGIAKGLLSERVAKWAAQDAYIIALCSSPENTELPDEIVAVQRDLEHLIRSMEFAIAHHDFPKARFYSNEERVKRALLQRLVSEHELDSPLRFSHGLRSSDGHA